MKVGCPGCGQHYDVDANSIEHFFHCTQCGIFFRGINAQPIKEKKFKHRKKSHLEDVGTVLPSGTQEVKYSENAQIVPDDADFDEEWDDEEEFDANRPKPLNLPSWGLPALIGGTAAVLLCIIVVLVIQAMQIRALRANLNSTAISLTLEQQRTIKCVQELEEVKTSRDALLEQVAALPSLTQEANEKIGAADLNAALLALDSRITDLGKAFGTSNPEVVAALDGRLQTMEKQIGELDEQNKAVSNYFKELMKLIGSTKNLTITRSILERISYLEAVLGRDAASARTAPRQTIVGRLATLEALVAGDSEGMQTSPNYPSGIVGQLEALKKQVNQLKWALGK